MQDSPIIFKEILLKGKKTGKIKHMIVIDEDQNEEPYKRNHNTLIKKQSQQLIVQKLNQLQKGIDFSRKSAALASDREDESLRSSQFCFKKPNTRRGLNKPVIYYSQDNYARIPELLDRQSFMYKKMVVRKCVELRVREYVRV